VCECVPHLVKVGPNDIDVVEVFGGCVVPIRRQKERVDALFACGDHGASIVGKGCSYGFDCFITKVLPYVFANITKYKLL
jgi:hypothetical protein